MATRRQIRFFQIKLYNVKTENKHTGKHTGCEKY